jgi:hypothetical protein
MGGSNSRRTELEHRMAANRAGDARKARCVETCGVWNDRILAGGDPDPSPLLGTALTAGYRWLQIACQDCRTVGEVDLATLDRHPETSISSLVPSLRCRSCPNSKRMPRLVALSIVPPREWAVR